MTPTQTQPNLKMELLLLLLFVFSAISTAIMTMRFKKDTSRTQLFVKFLLLYKVYPQTTVSVLLWSGDVEVNKNLVSLQGGLQGQWMTMQVMSTPWRWVGMCHTLKGNTTVIFNKNMLESMSIQIFPTYCFCCKILLIIKINLLCSPLLVSISSVRRLTRHSNWIKVYVKLATRHTQCKISVENFNFLLENFSFFI